MCEFALKKNGRGKREIPEVVLPTVKGHARRIIGEQAKYPDVKVLQAQSDARGAFKRKRVTIKCALRTATCLPSPTGQRALRRPRDGAMVEVKKNFVITGVMTFGFRASPGEYAMTSDGIDEDASAASVTAAVLCAAMVLCGQAFAAMV